MLHIGGFTRESIDRAMTVAVNCIGEMPFRALRRARPINKVSQYWPPPFAKEARPLGADQAVAQRKMNVIRRFIRILLLSLAPAATGKSDKCEHIVAVIAATGGGKLGTPMGDAYVAFALPPDKR